MGFVARLRDRVKVVLKTIPSPDLEGDEDEEDDEDEDEEQTEEATSETYAREWSELGTVRKAWYSFRVILSRMLASVSRRFWVAPPDIGEIIHYACCRTCRRKCEAQGWRVELKHNGKIIYEVTFKDAEYDRELKQKSRERLYV